MKIGALFFLLLVSSRLVSWAQSPFGYYFQDTIKPNHRISGSLDSVDHYLATYQQTLPGFFNPNSFQFSYADLNRTWYTPYKKRYSAIPHVAFAYSMGSKMAQFGRVTYTQTIDTNTYLQFDYTRNSTNGNLRNSKFERNSVQLGLMHESRYYGTILDVSFAFDNTQQSDGLRGDTLRSGYPLAFQASTKNNASYKQRQLAVSWKNYISFVKDSTHKFGLLLQPQFEIRNFRYTESDTLEGIYGFYNYDSVTTSDYWEASSLRLNGGVFYRNNAFQLEGGVSARYWDYDNLIYHSDTTEIAAFAAFNVNWKGIRIDALGNMTFIGALGEKDVLVTAQKQLKKNDLSLQLGFAQKYPDLAQRAYYGNTLQYSWQNRILATRSHLQLNWKNNNRILPFGLRVFGESNTKMPVFLSGKWRQDTLTNLNVAGVELNFEYRYKVLLIQGRASYRVSSQNVLPNWLTFGRLAYNGTLFKGKKLKTVTGVEVGYISPYTLLDYAPVANTYYFGASGQRFGEMMKLHFFTQFDLGYFRWFIRVENIEQTFLKKPTYQAIGYPVTPFQFRFGVSWDFFN